MSGGGSARQTNGRGRRGLLRALGVALSFRLVEVALDVLFGKAPARGGAGDPGADYRRELRTYLVGFTLALLLTLVPYALVYCSALPRFGLLLAIGGFALAQGIVHLRCFLHIDPPRQNTDDLHLVLFTSLILFLMIGGTVLILGNLATRMH